MAWLQRLFAVLLVLSVTACEDAQAPLVVGGKNFAENMIVAEMIAALAEEEGLPVARRIGLGSTRLTMEALRRGDIDVYPEYNGTGLVMLGQPPIAEGNEALARVRELFAPLGLTWGDRFGFANDYGLAMRRDRAEALGIETISDLTRAADRLRLGIEDDFRTRPLDGFEPLVRRYGMSFSAVRDVPLEDRNDLYDMLIDREVDAILVYTTDGQITDFDLVVLEDDLGFFPVYEAAPLVRDTALERFPALADVLGRLAGTLDNESMRLLNNRVAVLGEDPAEVARSELARLGLVEGVVGRAALQPLVVAVSPSATADGEAAAVLRATRRAFAGRNVELAASIDPLTAITDGEARIGMVGAPAFFTHEAAIGAEKGPSLRPGFEAIGLVGESFLHVFALEPDVTSLADVERIATGPVGSTGHRTANTLVRGLDLTADLVPVEAPDGSGFAEALRDSGAPVAMVMQPLRNSTVRDLLEGGARLLSVDGWDNGNNRIVYPYLQPVRLTAADYPEIDGAVETLSAQLVLVGPAPQGERGVGDQGPGASFIPSAQPLGGDTVRALDNALGQTAEIHPILPQSIALAPAFPSPPSALNPAPAISFLTVLVIAMLVWMAWLLFRTEYR